LDRLLREVGNEQDYIQKDYKS